MLTNSEIAYQAASYLERGWTRHAFARNARSGTVSSCDPSAVCWCMGGAVLAVTRGTHSGERMRKLDEKFHDFLGHYMLAYNDLDCKNQAAAVATMRDFAAWLAKEEKGQ